MHAMTFSVEPKRSDRDYTHIDFRRRFRNIIQLGLRTPESLRRLIVDLMIRFEANRMMDHQITVLHASRRLAHDMDDLDLLSHRTRNTVHSTHFADAMSRDETPGCILDSGIAISGIGGVQLVGVADPFQALHVVDLVQKLEVEVARNAKDGVDAGFVDPRGSSVRVARRLSSNAPNLLHRYSPRGIVAITITRLDVGERQEGKVQGLANASKVVVEEESEASTRRYVGPMK